ncbi:MAG: PHB depolymerase family esterase [Calditrichaceae bacterium]
MHIPVNYNTNKQLPLVLVLHGAFSNAGKIEEHSGFSLLADKDGFFAVYPNGGFGLFGFLQHWNAGFCCGKAQADSVDDVGFLEMVIKDIQQRFNIDSARIYMVGFSNGGMMTYRFASEHTDILAAAAPMAASIGGRASTNEPIWIIPKPLGPLPLIIFHSMDDTHVPYDGGISPAKGGEREYVSVRKSVEFWIRNNGCSATAVTGTMYNDQVIHKLWPDVTGSHNDIELYLLKSWGHKWPGRYFTDKLKTTDPLHGFDAAEIIWEFFKEHHK